MPASTVAPMTDALLNDLPGQYCVELERSNHGRETINLSYD